MPKTELAERVSAPTKPRPKPKPKPEPKPKARREYTWLDWWLLENAASTGVSRSIS
jgi:hypothetical protein